jgi:DEAD_2
VMLTGAKMRQEAQRDLALFGMQNRTVGPYLACRTGHLASEPLGPIHKQGGRKKKCCGCPFLRSEAEAQQEFQDELAAGPMDVEELGRLGRRRGVCPYYAARRALPEADLILVPYGSLLTEVRGRLD